ncbi:MAG: transglycosylase SLT domain-containing protein [Deltaproteobacteria bacterium]|nr:transglycosylase SLT domain-containing protein [Deltaproteobacteria bacterium]
MNSRAGPGCRVALLLAWALLIASHSAAMADDDPWRMLRDAFHAKPGTTGPVAGEKNKKDPWARLRAIYLPFNEKDEAAAQTDKNARKRVAGKINGTLAPFAALIKDASNLFNVPEAIISALIMVESGGDPDARASTSSAAGLMQTISSTFKAARKSLGAKGIIISASPVNPRSSIMAGTWYLDRMYARAVSDRRIEAEMRRVLSSWKKPLEYYYAGPVHGAKRSDTVIIYAGGRKVVVDKRAYSTKVLKWAKILRKTV